MHSGPELTIAIILCFTLAVGAAMRMIAGRARVPYTITMLLVGVAVGVLLEQLSDGAESTGVLASITGEGGISPDLIVFLFLPLLVFESAFSLEVHAFRQNLGPVLLLAGPAMLISTATIGLFAVAITASSWQWGWLEGLVFGALISATDPVAVVALLRELGAPRRLRLLIEGESLLNDGTAIVVFSVIVGVVTGAVSFAAGDTLWHFLRVTIGGLLVGAVLAAGVTTWMSRTFNAPLIEITLTLVLAYASMLVAEALLHVSGVIAVVTAGLWMSGRGRLQISPEVVHFLHRFWEMLSYLANTLIFFLVGVVIATQLNRAEPGDFVLIAIAYAGVMAIRVLLTLAFRPAMNRVADPMSRGETLVMAWGGLRGAVSLALALVISRHPEIPDDLGRQILLLTAGVVLLSIVVNGWSMPWLLRKLRFDRPPPSDRLADSMARAAVLERVAGQIESLSHSRDLRTVDWSEVQTHLDERRDSMHREISETREELASAGARERDLGTWRQALSIEREAVWSAFAGGTLGAAATEILDHEVDLKLDRVGRGEDGATALRCAEREGWRARGVRLANRLGGRRSRWLERIQLEMIALRYEICRGEKLAAERVLEEMKDREAMEPEVREAVVSAYRDVRHASVERLEDLRSNLPEVTHVIETRLAERIGLNLEREDLRQLESTGAIDPESAARELAVVERRMKALKWSREDLELPETCELCRSTPLFAGLDEESLTKLAALTRERAISPGEELFAQGDRGESLFIIARGAVAVVAADPRRGGEPTLLDVLGGGDVLGEMALLTGAPRIATARAITTLTVGEIERDALEDLMRTHPHIRDEIWKRFGERRFDNHLRTTEGFGHLDRQARRDWFRRGTLVTLEAGEAVPGDPPSLAFLVSGVLERNHRRHADPVLLALDSESPLRANETSRVAVLPSPLAGAVA